LTVARSPAFQFYANDFRADANVTSMTLEEVGAYILLLTFCWTEGGISQDPKALMRLLRTDEKTWARIWPALAPCFTADGEKYVQKRMELVRAAQDEYRGMQSAKGKKSAASRWGVADSVTVRLQPESNRGMIRLQPEGNRGVTALVTDRLQPEGNSSSSTSSSTSVQIRENAAYLYQSPTPAAQTLPAYVGKQRPIPGYRRLRIFRWMLDDMLATLGDHAEAFDLDKWLLTLDASPGLLPVELWPWLKEQVLEQAAIRGYGAADTGPKKKTAVEIMIEKLKAEGFE
jgi:uncharacterized protein YdaU (DUF1376 family)